MTVLVTGGVGYLGSRLIRELPDHPSFAGDTIRIYDNLRQPRFQSLWDLPSYADYEFVEADIRDEESLADAMEGVDTVFHLAAITNASQSFDLAEKTHEVNLEGSLTAFEAARNADVSQFVYVSTCSVYGPTDREITETFECDPASPYGKAKLRAEREILQQDPAELDVTGLRLGTVYGWSQGMRFDTVVDKFAYLAATGQPLTVYENAEDQKRPYLHVQDAVRALLFAASGADGGEIYNVVGQNRRLRDVVSAIESHFSDVTIEYTRTENLDQLSYVVSDEKIVAEGFETMYSIDDGVRELADKFRALNGV